MKFERVFYWLLVVFITYLIIEVTRKIFGGSLGFEDLTVALLLGNLGYLFAIHTKVSNVNSRLSEHLGWHKGKENSR